MKRLLFLLAALFSTIGISQLQLNSTEKVCVDTDVSHLLYIEFVDEMLVISVDYPGLLIGIDPINLSTVWTKKIKVGYGIKALGKKLIFSRNANTYDDKTNQTNYGEMLYTLDPKTGNFLDSVRLNYNVLTLSRSAGTSDNYALISAKEKFKAEIINRKTGANVYTLLEENSNGIMPNCIQTDPAEKFVAVGCANGNGGLYLFDFKTGKKLLNLTASADIHCIAFTNDSKYCLYVQNKKLKVLNTSSLTLEKEITLNNDTPLLAIHPDNENIVLCGFGNSAPVSFMNWKTEKSVSAGITRRGGIPVFTTSGDLFMPFQDGVTCKVDKLKTPYLAKLKFGNTTSTVSTSNEIKGSFDPGQRVYILYTGDNKYYSGVIVSQANGVYEVIFDDNTKSSVKESQLKVLPAIKVGDTIQVKRSDNKFYSGKVLEIKGEILLVQYSNASEWVTLRNVMQVE